MTNILKRVKQKEIDVDIGESNVKTEVVIGVMRPRKPKNADNNQKWKEARKDLS
jgi:hypothetical protein